MKGLIVTSKNRTAAVFATGGAGIGFAAVAAVAALVAQPAQAAPPQPAEAYSGPGWRIAADDGLRSINPDKPLRITFGSARSRDLLADYLRPAAAQASEITGADITVTDTVTDVPDKGCAPGGTIAVELEFEPIGKPGFSWGGMCYADADRSLYSGHIKITPEWFKPGWFGDGAAHTEASITNGVAHELGHALGLRHPNTDLNADGKAKAFECPTNADGSLPLMCSPNSLPNVDTAGRFTAADAAGLRALVDNYRARAQVGGAK